MSSETIACRRIDNEKITEKIALKREIDKRDYLRSDYLRSPSAIE